MSRVVIGIVKRETPELAWLLMSSKKDFGEFTGYYYPPGGHVEDGRRMRKLLFVWRKNFNLLWMLWISCTKARGISLLRQCPLAGDTAGEEIWFGVFGLFPLMGRGHMLHFINEIKTHILILCVLLGVKLSIGWHIGINDIEIYFLFCVIQYLRKYLLVEQQSI